MLLCLEVAQKTLNSKGHFVSRSMPLGPFSFRLPLVPPPLFRRFLFVGDDIICQPWRINFTSRIKDCGILLLHQINTKYIQLSSIQYIFWYWHQYWIFLAYAQVIISIKYCKHELSRLQGGRVRSEKLLKRWWLASIIISRVK